HGRGSRREPRPAGARGRDVRAALRRARGGRGRCVGHGGGAAGGGGRAARGERPVAIGPAAPARALRRKEWTLLLRDPWLASQTLMQLLYLLPPALLLWRSFVDDSGALALIVPVLIMAAGQLAGGLAWLTISGEDAPDLVAAAPVSARGVVR